MPAPEQTPLAARAESRRTLAVVAILAALVALPLALLVGLAKVELPWVGTRRAAPPQWASLPPLRATTGDGTVVRARLAVDVDDAAARRVIEQRGQQIGLLLESTIAGRNRDEVRSDAGMKQLAGDLRDRLNGYLAESGAGAVRQVVVQDLLFGQP